MIYRFHFVSFRVISWIVFFCLFSQPSRGQIPPSPRLRVSAAGSGQVSSSDFDYLWYEAENMSGISETARHEPQLNPSYLDVPAAKAPGWSISGPGVSAEWSQGGESEWNSVAASPDETQATIWQDLEVPRAGAYRLWVRYADWANKTESFVVRISQAAPTNAAGVSTRMGSSNVS